MVLRDIASGFPVDLDAKLHAARNEGDRTRRHFHPAEFRGDPEGAVLRNDQKLAVGIDEHASRHGLGCAVKMHRDALEVGRIAVREHRHHSVDEVGVAGEIVRRVPAKAVGRERLIDGSRSEQMRRRVTREGPVIGRWPHAVKPAPAVLMARRGEGTSRQLLGIEAEGRPLRRVAAVGKRILDGFTFEMAAQAGHVTQRIGHARRLVRPRFKNKRARPQGAAPACGKGTRNPPARSDLVVSCG